MFSMKFVDLSEHLLKDLGASDSKNYIVSHAHACDRWHFSFKKLSQDLSLSEAKWTGFRDSQKCDNIAGEGSEGLQARKSHALLLVVQLLATYHHTLVYFEDHV